MSTFDKLRINGVVPMLISESGTGIPIPVAILLCLIGGIIAYLLGSLNFAVIISKYKFKEDIRDFGSGNGGMTNMLRTYGKGAAAFTLLGDAAKAAVSVLIGTILCGEAGAFIAGLCCTLGHAFPIFYGFKGGKGVVVTAITLLCLDWLSFLVLFTIFVILVATTKYLSLGSIVGMLMYPLMLNRLYPMTHGGMAEGAIPAIVSVLNAALVIWLHRENLKRLWQGKENKFSLKKKDKFKKDEKAETTAEASAEDNK